MRGEDATNDLAFEGSDILIFGISGLPPENFFFRLPRWLKIKSSSISLGCYLSRNKDDSPVS